MEQKDKSRHQKIFLAVKTAFWLVILFWFMVCLITTINSQENYRFTDHNCSSFDQGWTLSGEGTPVTIPGRLEEEESVIQIENTIPENIGARTALLVKGLHQDIEVRIDGIVVGSLDNSSTRRFGRHTPSGYLLIPLSESAAGKPVEIQYSALEPETAGQLNDIRIGTEVGILFWMLGSYLKNVVFAVLLLYTGVVIIIFGLVLRLAFQENSNVNITYLGTTAVCIAIWMLAESRLKQFYYGDLAVGEMILWEALFLAPIPMLFYVDRLQGRRYCRQYIIGSILALGLNVTLMVLELTNVLDFFQMHLAGWVVILGCALLVFTTILIDWIKGYRQWKLLTGISVLLICIVLQMCGYENSATGIVSNNYVSLGLILFIIMMGISAVTGMLRQKQEQILAIKADETKMDFLANMSHEIRTPINAILGFDEMILREVEDEAIIEYAANIKKAGDNLLYLVNDILDTTKVESGKVELIEEEYRTSNMLSDVINMTYIRAQEKGLSFDIFIGKDIPRKLYGDEMRVKQILTNVLNNAVKYTEAGSVTLSVSFDVLEGSHGRLRISVADTGIGIKEEDISRITESFQRFDIQRNRSIEGTGLGMSIVANLLDVMGGTLKIYSTYGEGSDFRITIPQEVRDATPIGNYQSDHRKELRVQPAYRVMFTAPQAKVLFVDDNFMNLSVAKGLLKRTKLQIDTADSGAACLELTRNKKYDLIFMDHLMPEMDGVETLRRLRREVGNPNQYTSVIALTANAIKGVKEFYIKEGFHEYLTKPVEGEKLEEVLLRLLPHEYIISAEEGTGAVLDRLKEDVMQDAVEGDEAVSIETCMKELEALLEQAHIHLADGYRFAGRSMGQFHWMIMLFVESFREKYGRISELYERQDVEGYTIEVHALKSNAKGIGANQLYQLAWEHEQQSRTGNWSYVREHWEELCQEWSCVVNGILNYVGGEPITHGEAAVAAEPVPEELGYEQKMLLENSLSFIRDYDADPARALIENLLQEVESAEIKENLGQVVQELESLNYEEAERIIRQLQTRR